MRRAGGPPRAGRLCRRPSPLTPSQQRDQPGPGRIEWQCAWQWRSAPVQVFGCRDDETDHALKGPATKKRQGTKSRAVGQWLAASAMGIACRRCSRWWARPQHRTTCMSACRGAQESAMGIWAGTRSASTGGRWIDGRHRVERRQPASQNTSTTFAFRHECCARGDLMFSAYVISNSCAWQK